MLEPEWAFYDFRRIWPEADEARLRENEARFMRMTAIAASFDFRLLNVHAPAHKEPAKPEEPEAPVVVEPFYLGVPGYR